MLQHKPLTTSLAVVCGEHAASTELVYLFMSEWILGLVLQRYWFEKAQGHEMVSRWWLIINYPTTAEKRSGKTRAHKRSDVITRDFQKENCRNWEYETRRFKFRCIHNTM